MSDASPHVVPPAEPDLRPRRDPHGSGGGEIGRRRRRREDDRFITGTGSYLDDVSLPGTLHAAVLRSPHAHARILGLDVEPALSMPGVRLVLTAADLAAEGLPALPLDMRPPGGIADRPEWTAPAQPVLAIQEVRYVGEPVAFVVADSPSAAREAAEAVAVDYEDLPAVTAVEVAESDSILSWTDRNTNLVFEHAAGDAAAVDAAFRRAHRQVRLNVPVNRVSALALEARGCIGAYDGSEQRFTLHVGTQRPHNFQRALADGVFRIPRDRMRVISPDVGGGFGAKNGLFPEYVLCLVAARRLACPVKWTAERSEALVSDNHGRDNLFRAEAALDADGHILAVRVERLMNLGAYTAPRSMVPTENGLTHLTGVYEIPALHVVVRGYLTNTACVTVYRGAGRPENVFCCERLIDAAAAACGADPVSFRRRNLIRPKSMPWRNPLGTVYDGIDFEGFLDRALQAIDYGGFRQRQERSTAAGRSRGLGISLLAEDLHGSPEPAPATFFWNGSSLVVAVATASAGHGHETSFLQIAADLLGLPFERLSFLQSDTGLIPDGIGTAASWSTTLGGSSVLLCAEAAIEQGRRIAARELEAAMEDVVFTSGNFRVAGTDLAVGWSDIFQAEPSFRVSAVFDDRGCNIPVACHACEVEIDPETGIIELAAYAVAQDAGRLINPTLVEGQLHGGIAQGVGQAWIEEIVYDRESGQIMTGSLMDYGVPRADHLPRIRTVLTETPDKNNPLGVKGVGEAGATGSPAAFANAVLNAAAPWGVTCLDAPFTPERIWRAVAAAQPRPG